MLRNLGFVDGFFGNFSLIFREKIFENTLFLLSVSVALAEYSVSAEYSAETFGRNHLRSDTNCHGIFFPFEHVCNVSWSKLSVSACLEYVMVKIDHFRMPECVLVQLVSFSMARISRNNNN
jgi:hypothetical protein